MEEIVKIELESEETRRLEAQIERFEDLRMAVEQSDVPAFFSIDPSIY